MSPHTSPNATLLAVLKTDALAFFNGARGKGGLVLWPLFGMVNQLMAVLALAVEAWMVIETVILLVAKPEPPNPAGAQHST